MRLTSRLLGWLSRAFDRDPGAVLGLRLRYDGAASMRWRVSDGVLTTAVAGAPAAGLTIDLTAHTIRSLAGAIALHPGYRTPYVDTDVGGAAAARLLDGSGDQAESNGDHLYLYTSNLYALLDAYAVELEGAEAAIEALPLELSTTTADGGWLDYLGSYYNVPRQVGELDGGYSLRIIAEVLRPLGNNLAIEQAIEDLTGQAVSIVDVVQFNAPEPRFDGVPSFNGAYNFQAQPVPVYCLFDATVGYDLLGGDPPALEETRLRGIIERLRDAGTQLRTLALGASRLLDATPGPPVEDDRLALTIRRSFDGAFRFDGSATFSGPVRATGTIETLILPDAPTPIGLKTGHVLVGAGVVEIPDGRGGIIPLDVTYYG